MNIGSLKQIAHSLGWVINRDGDGALGQAIVQAFEANSQGQGVSGNLHLTWTVVDPSQFPTNDEVGYAVVNEQAWAAVVGKSISHCKSSFRT